MEGHTETKEEVAEQYEKVSVFFEQVIKSNNYNLKK